MPTVFAVIPARGGSKGVPGKNLRTVGGGSLISRAVNTALATPEIAEVYVSSDSRSILDEAKRAGARSVLRPDAISGDSATSELALIHWLKGLEENPDLVVFIECTSPFIAVSDLSRAIALVKSGEFDSVFSAAATDLLLWRREAESLRPLGHNPLEQTLRQQRSGNLVESGAFFVFRPDGLVETGSRFHGKIGAVEVPSVTSIEIDELWHLEVADFLLERGFIPPGYA